MGICCLSADHTIVWPPVSDPFRKIVVWVPLLLQCRRSRRRRSHGTNGPRPGRPSWCSTRCGRRSHPVLSLGRRTHAICLVRLPVLGARSLFRRSSAANRRPALVAGHRCRHWFRYADEIHDGILCTRHRGGRYAHQHTPASHQQMALDRGGFIRSDFSAQSALASPASFHLARLSQAHPRTRCPHRTHKRLSSRPTQTHAPCCPSLDRRPLLLSDLKTRPALSHAGVDVHRPTPPLYRRQGPWILSGRSLSDALCGWQCVGRTAFELSEQILGWLPASPGPGSIGRGHSYGWSDRAPAHAS